MNPKTVFLIFVVASLINFGLGEPQVSASDWWKHASFYQIYPRSFKDDNNDGIGDLRGIIDKLDHFPDVGVDAIWLSPIFRSPGVDQGYDISDYRDVDPDYGTIDELKELIEGAHAKGVKVVLDFVPNHTSDRHQWFLDSVDDVEEYRDYYIWADGKVGENGDRQPPNNWVSVFKNSAWTWNEKRQQYYLHQFASAQPDLNYRNGKVAEAMKDVIKFWLDHGVDGFRIDAIPHLFEVEDLHDEPLSNSPGYNSSDYEYLNHIYTKDQPETYDMVYQWRQFVDEYVEKEGGDARVLMTEAYSDVEHTMLYFGTPNGTKLGAHFTFNFNLITDININSAAQDIVDSVKRWLDNVPQIYTSNWVLGNHDNHRVASRFGPENVDGFNMLKALLPGVAVTYNGEEIGQEDGEVSYEEGQDPSARDPEIFERVSRDFERTPFQWDDSVNAGFNEGYKPWLPVSVKYLRTNLKQENETEGPSHYKIYKTLANLRKDSVLLNGNTEIKAVEDQVLFLKRTYNNTSLALIFNKGTEEAVVDVSGEIPAENTIKLINSNSTREANSTIIPSSLKLDPHEALIVAFNNRAYYHQSAFGLSILGTIFALLR